MIARGYGGRILLVDVTDGRSRIEPITDEMARGFLGGNGGLYQSTDGGVTFTTISGLPNSGLPAGPVSDLAVDPNNMDWQSQATLARLALAEAAWAHGDRATSRQMLERAEADNARLLAHARSRATWRLAQQGQALRLRWMSGDRPDALRAALDTYLGQVRQAEAQGVLLDTDLSLLAATAVARSLAGCVAMPIPDAALAKAAALAASAS